MKRFLVLGLLLAGCDSGPPAQVAGKYQGFFGAPYGDQKIGCQGELKQTGVELKGTFHLSMQKSGRQSDLDCVAEGEVKGKYVKLRIHEDDTKFAIKLNGEWAEKGEPRLFGQAEFEGRESQGQFPFLFKRQ